MSELHSHLDSQIVEWISVAKGDVVGHPFHGNQYRTATEQMKEASNLSKAQRELSRATEMMLPKAWRSSDPKEVQTKDLKAVADKARNVAERAKGLADNLRRSASVYANAPRPKNDFHGEENQYWSDGTKSLTSQFSDAADKMDAVAKAARELTGHAENALKQDTSTTSGRFIDEYGDFHPWTKETVPSDYLTNRVIAGRDFPAQIENLGNLAQSAELAVAKTLIAIEQADPNTVIKATVIKGDLPGHIFHGNQYQSGNTAEVGRTAEAKGQTAIKDAASIARELDDAYWKAADEDVASDEDGNLHFDRTGTTSSSWYRPVPETISHYEELWNKHDALCKEAYKQLSTASDAYALMSHHAQKAGDSEMADTYANRAGELSKMAAPYKDGSKEPTVNIYDTHY